MYVCVHHIWHSAVGNDRIIAWKGATCPSAVKFWFLRYKNSGEFPATELVFISLEYVGRLARGRFLSWGNQTRCGRL